MVLESLLSMQWLLSLKHLLNNIYRKTITCSKFLYNQYLPYLIPLTCFKQQQKKCFPLKLTIVSTQTNTNKVKYYIEVNTCITQTKTNKVKYITSQFCKFNLIVLYKFFILYESRLTSIWLTSPFNSPYLI